MCASRAALGRGLDVDLRLSAKQGEALRGRLDVRTKCRPGKVLAISTVTDCNRSGIDVRLKRDLAAMTTAIDLHGAFLLSHGIGCRAFGHGRLLLSSWGGNPTRRVGIWTYPPRAQTTRC